jgi:hypothetical protein
VGSGDVSITSVVTFVDTSVLCNLLDVPLMSDRSAEVKAEARARGEHGERFVLPVTAVIETGNHIANVKQGDRRAAAERFVGLIQAIREDHTSWVLHEVEWDDAFLVALCAGSTTGQPFVDLAGHGLLGAGDVAILVERERFKARSAHLDVRIWTLEATLGAYA